MPRCRHIPEQVDGHQRINWCRTDGPQRADQRVLARNVMRLCALSRIRPPRCADSCPVDPQTVCAFLIGLWRPKRIVAASSRTTIDPSRR